MPMVEGRGGTPWWEHLVGVGVCVMVAVAFFWPAIAEGRMFTTVTGHQSAVFPWAAWPTGHPDNVQSDQADLSYPWHVLLDRSLEDGALPMWDPHSFGGGYPLFANGSSAQLHPLRLALAATTDPIVAHLGFAFTHLVLGGVAAYALGRHLRLGLAASTLLATAWMASSFNLAWLHLEVVTPMVLFLPLDVLAVRWAWRRRTVGAAVAAGIPIGLTLVAGHVLFMGITLATAGAYAACLGARDGRDAWRERRQVKHAVAPLARVAVTFVVGGGLAAAVLVPTALALGDSARAPFSYDELRATQLADLGDFTQTFVPPPRPIDGERIHFQPFVGTIAAALAVVGACTRRPGAGVGRGIAGVLLLVSVGTPLTWLAFHLVPGMDVFRPYTRFSGWYGFGVAVLAGVGLQALVDRVRPMHPDGEPASPRRGHGLAPARLALGGAATVLVAVNVVQLLDYGRSVNPAFPPRRSALVYPATPLLDALAAEDARTAWPERVLPVRRQEPGDAGFTAPVLYAAEALVPGLDSGGGYDSSLPGRTSSVLHLLSGHAPEAAIDVQLAGAYIPHFASAFVRYDLLERLGYQLLVTPPTLPADLTWGNDALRALDPQLRYSGPDGNVYAFGGSAGPWLVGAVEEAPDDRAALERFADPSFDHRAAVVLTTDEAERLEGFAPDGRPASVRRAQRGTNDITIDLETDGDVLLVVPANWDPGWHATVDADDVPVLRGNFNQQVVPVPAGGTRVRLRYEPPGLQAGVVGSAATAAGIFVVGTNGWLRRRQRSAGTSSARNW